MRCSSCGHENREFAAFCERCGARVAPACPRCGAHLRPSARFCDSCGQRLAESLQPSAAPNPGSYTPRHLAEKILTEQAALAARGAPEGERKTVTALFADIKSSMELLEDLDPEDARRLIDPALQLMMDAVHRYEGYVAQSTGDGIFALFGAPIAHEDHPRRACYAALKMQEDTRSYAEAVRRDKGVNLQVRVGLNTGEVVLRSIRTEDLHADYIPIGHSVSLAARMESLATPGSIVASEHTQKLTAGYFQLKALGPAKIKGVSEPVLIYEVTGVGPLRSRFEVAARRGLVRFVGRHGEMAQLRRAWETAQMGHGQILAVVGEAGVGKSRLFYEFKLPVKSECLVLEAFSASYGKAYAYLPVIDLLKTYFQITLEDDERRRREKVTGKVLTLDRTLEDTLPYLFALLGITEPTSSLGQMDPQIRRRRTSDAIKHVLVRETLNQPVILVFEDLHWIDGETQAVLDVVSESVATARLLLLVNYRPEYQHGWGSKTYYTRLRLDPLGREDAEALLAALVGEGAQPGLPPLKQLILEKTEGNPFFMEEVVQTLAEEEVLAGERGCYRLQKSPGELHIPATVQGVLAARIDRLSAKEKDLVQTLAVIGKEFPLGLVRQVTKQADEALDPLLTQLQAAEFIYEQPAFPEPEYTFKHALTQEVAYHSLLIERRKALHERTAQAIEGLHRDGLDEHYSELAHHYGRTDNTRKAVEYLHLAGQQAARHSAYDEATSRLTRCLELIATLPETPDRDHQEWLVQSTLGPVLMATRGYAVPDVEKAYTRARDLCHGVAESAQLLPVLCGLEQFHLVRAEHKQARELAGRFLELAQKQDDPALLSIAHLLLGEDWWWGGELRRSREHVEKGVALYNPQQYRSHAALYSVEPRVGCLAYAAWTLFHLGYADQALKRSREAVNMARELSDPVNVAFALCWDTGVLELRGEMQACQERAEAAIALTTERGFPDWLAMATLQRSRALAEQGQLEEGITQMRLLLDGAWGMGVKLGRPWNLGWLAEAHAKSGQVAEGLSLVGEALDLMNETDERISESYLERLEGELLLAISEDNRAEAEACFRQAIDVARRQSAKSHELRAAISLSRLWQKQGKKDEARQLLAEIYGWFTEGFDTRDLKEATALLDELA